jgi:hypothetical protein
MRRDLTFDVVYPHPPKRIWQALTNVRWTIEPAGAGTHVRLEHGGFEGLGGLALSLLLGRGWRRHVLHKLAQALNQIDRPMERRSDCFHGKEHEP